MSNTDDELDPKYQMILDIKDPDGFIDMLTANSFIIGNLDGKIPVDENRVVFEKWLKNYRHIDEVAKQLTSLEQGINQHTVPESMGLVTRSYIVNSIRFIRKALNIGDSDERR